MALTPEEKTGIMTLITLVIGALLFGSAVGFLLLAASALDEGPAHPPSAFDKRR